jgi:LPXTG-motif cell wall-anchored protein
VQTGLEVLSVNGLVQTRGRFFMLLAPLVLIVVAVPAGRSDAAEEKVSATTVAEGLKTIQKGLEEAVAAGDDTAKAHEAVEAVEPVWAMIGGTIKTADERSYASFEKGIEDVEAAIKSGDATKAAGAAGGFASNANFYVAKFSAAAGADTSAAAPARKADAAPAADRSAAGAPKPDGAAGAPAVEPGDATLARTGSTSDALAALAGLALALGGLSVIGGARRRPSPIA